MKKRFLSFVLAGILALLMAFGVLPMSARAVLPVGFVESAFASYAMSSGYTFFSEEMDDPLFLGLFRELYDDFVTVKSALGQTIRRWDEYDNRDVYLDRSGNIVVSYGVAQDWSGAMEWIQSHYDIPDNSNTPVNVVSPGMTIYSSGSGIFAYKASFTESVQSGRDTYYYDPHSFGLKENSPGQGLPIYFITDRPDYLSQGLFLTQFNSKFYFRPIDPTGSAGLYLGSVVNGVMNMYSGTYIPQNTTSFTGPQELGDGSSYIDLPVSTINPFGFTGSLSAEGGLLSGLSASIAHTLVDVAQGMTDDDAVVIGVGAVSGITEGEMADFIADGIRADTLEPSATITATDVIDTPVQPYPDIDGLGLPSLGAALTSRFPFCIPWDFVDTVQLLAADPVAPDFSFDLLPQRIRDYCHITASTEVRFNMGDPKFSKVGVFCRWGSLISFCFGLAVLTKRMIWTA